jgi:hypothetical protein
MKIRIASVLIATIINIPQNEYKNKENAEGIAAKDLIKIRSELFKY